MYFFANCDATSKCYGVRIFVALTSAVDTALLGLLTLRPFRARRERGKLGKVVLTLENGNATSVGLSYCFIYRDTQK